jgi:hypothetical protein
VDREKELRFHRHLAYDHDIVKNFLTDKAKNYALVLVANVACLNISNQYARRNCSLRYWSNKVKSVNDKSDKSSEANTK